MKVPCFPVFRLVQSVQDGCPKKMRGQEIHLHGPEAWICWSGLPRNLHLLPKLGYAQEILLQARSPSSALSHPFLGEGSPRIDSRKRVPLFKNSLPEDLARTIQGAKLHAPMASNLHLTRFGYGSRPQVLVHVSVYQGKPFWGYPIFDNHSHLAGGSSRGHSQHCSDRHRGRRPK